MTDAPRHIVAKPSFLTTLPRKLERPMLFLSFVWFLFIIIELVNGTSPLLLNLGTVLWALFVFYFGLRLAIVPNRVVFLKRNWLFVLAILVPVLRFFPFLQRLALARALTATFGMQVIWMFASADIPNQTSIHQLSAEVALLRKAIGAVLQRVPDTAPRFPEPQEPSQIKRGIVSVATGPPPA